MHYILIPFIAIVSLWMLLSSCTINLNNVSTRGTASDVIDDVSKNDVDTNVKLPIEI